MSQGMVVLLVQGLCGTCTCRLINVDGLWVLRRNVSLRENELYLISNFSAFPQEGWFTSKWHAKNSSFKGLFFVHRRIFQ